MPDEKKLSTYPLDDAMKELLELYDKCASAPTKAHANIANQPNQNILGSTDMNSKGFPGRDDKSTRLGVSSSKEKSDNTSSLHDKSIGIKPDGNETIDKLQQRQSELQSQLDDVMKIAQELEQKQKRKITGLVQGDTPEQHSENDIADDDIELIEFHQIEIELRISELNRQLSNIQEELRLRLYKRLQTKTIGCSSSANDTRQRSSKKQDCPSRRHSTQTDESTPPSSSCSDETNATSSIDMITHSSTKNSIDLELANQFDKTCILTKPSEESTKYQHVDRATDVGSRLELAAHVTELKSHETTEKIDLQTASNPSYSCDVVPSVSGSLRKVQDNASKTPSRIPIISNAHKNITKNDCNIEQQNRIPVNEIRDDTQTATEGYRNCHVNNDLERIEEGEEDDFDYYCNSQKFRSIYEEKISPMVLAKDLKGPSELDHVQPIKNSRLTDSQKTPTGKTCYNESNYATPKPSQDNRFNINNINSEKRGNRPLTIYLPRPDDDINLVESVQSLGHDLSIISSDLKITATSAEGYLYKSCSNNSKKWLKRYFYFSRQSKTLSYYENEEQLVRNIDSPKCTIPFDDISDVYVDHRMSEKQKSTTRKSYVFVLATVRRKYILASAKAEAMRAWIDILFTAAKANDYFQEIDEEGESLSFNYDSFQQD